MNPRATWIWAAIAAALFAFIFVYQKLSPPDIRVRRILPMIQSATVTSVQVRPQGELEIRAERTNGTWVLTEPIAYQAQGSSIGDLLGALERLVPATYISSRELRERPEAEQEYGFSNPQASIVVTQPDTRVHVLIGTRTAPGDQVFLQVVGVEGVYVVDAALLKHLPLNANQWRDRDFADLQNLAFDRVTVTNAGRFFELQREEAEERWQLTKPIPARADAAKVDEALESLRKVRVMRFVTDKADTDLESLGLAPAELVIGFWQGTNPVSTLQFGKTLTNNTHEVYARASGRDTLMTVSETLIAPWRTSVSDFRDRHLVRVSQPVARLEVKAEDAFTVVKTNGLWRVLPQDFPADAGLMTNVIRGLERIEVQQFVKDVVTAPDLAGYGLAPAWRQYSLFSNAAMTNVSGVTTQAPLVEVQFGTNQEDRVLVRRTDENSIYAVSAAVTNLLPSRSWQMRDRQVFSFSMDEVQKVVLQQAGRKREIVRKAAHDWALAPGSAGIINDLAVEETVKGLSALRAAAWVAREPQNASAYGLTPESLEVTVELTENRRATVRLGSEGNGQFPFASTSLDGQAWVFEFPWPLYRDVISYLSVPANGS